ncbi:MAG: PQQ-like beta-propeller repeat protein [Planctomycetales bacterium]|nr:PQQ-like beta-propeller repeat protein [Planctomycetales bacterium]MCA9167334.1 PQQ-like beta-propeller repeat protein [Planctomycetales bacterium]
MKLVQQVWNPRIVTAIIVGTIGLALTRSLVAQQVDYDRQWPQWRGPQANGVAPHASPPLVWNGEKNVRWKIPVPGEGIATPIVWNEKVFVVAAVPTDRPADTPVQPHDDARTQPPNRYFQFTVFCFNRQTGDTIWQRVAAESVPREGHHVTNSYASGSPSTDGHRLYVSFGSHGMFCYSLDGDLLWQRDLGDMRTRRGWGEAVTPAIANDALIVNWDQEDDSSLIALDAATGDVKWQVPRDEPTTWTTPLIVSRAGKTQIIVNGQNRVRSYDAANGEVLWQCGGQTVNPIPSPIADRDTVYCFSGYQGAAGYAIPLDAQGDVTETNRVRWHHHENTPYVPSPILYDGQLYFTRANNGILTSLRASDGTVVFGPERIPGVSNLYASPVAAADRIYFTSREGVTTVIQPGSELKVLATNELGEPVDASPVPVGKQLLIRSTTHLYCIEE